MAHYIKQETRCPYHPIADTVFDHHTDESMCVECGLVVEERLSGYTEYLGRNKHGQIIPNWWDTEGAQDARVKDINRPTIAGPSKSGDDDTVSPLQEPEKECMAADNMAIEDIVKGINGGDEKEEILATRAIRKTLCKGTNPPIEPFINANVVPKLAEFLSRVSNPDLQFESAWALTNIASGTSDQTYAVVSAGAVAGLISLLGSPHPFLAKQAVWALGNIAGDGANLRDFVIEQGVIEPLLPLIKPDASVRFLRYAAWTLSNLCRHKNPFPSVSAVRQLLPALAQLIHNDDKEILADACWALSYLTDGPNERIQEVVDAGVVPRLVALLDHTEVSVITPSLRTIGNIVSGSDVQTDSVLAAGACPLLAKLLEHYKMNIIKEAARAVSNVAAGNSVQIEALFSNNVIRPLVEVFANGYSECQKEATWAITNITLGGNDEQIALLCQFGAIASLVTCLRPREP